jgi:putative glutamine amidotransferase
MIIGITMRYKQTSEEEKPFDVNYVLLNDFIRVADAFGVTLFPICSDTGLDKVAGLCDGLIVTGSMIDIDPSYYGKAPFCNPNPVDEFALDRKLIQAFSDKQKPVFGICGGMQALNVCFGGTLKRNMKGHYGTEHKVTLSDGSNFLKDAGAGSETLQVNSYHCQMVDRLADGFTAVARDEHDDIEAMQSENKLVLGVQWHPEIGFEKEEYHKLFAYFFRLCKNKKAA